MRLKRLQGDKERQNHCYYEFDQDAAPVGEGGMGVVYLGYLVDEKSGVRREVAIKVLHDDLPEEIYARAEREASIQLRHENLVEMLGFIVDFEPNRWGEPVYHTYVISEFLHGIELSDLLVGRLDGKEENAFARQLYESYVNDREKTSIKIIRNIASGVLALHDKGYIHRDIDPSNIMVTTDGHIKLIDFGIAKNLHTLGSKDKLLTAAGKFMGKAEYASPELVLGDVKSQNYTTDIYALGVLLFRLLVGRLPFEGSQYEVLQQQLKRKLPVHAIKNRALVQVVKKATEKLQRHRYGTVAEFRVAIDTAARHQATWLDAYRNYVYAAAVVVVVVIIGIVAYLKTGRSASMDVTSNITGVANAGKSVEVRFAEALALLDSNIADSVRTGFDVMLALADAGDDRAKQEVGITYFASMHPTKDLRSTQILLRRKNLGLKDRNPQELSNTIKYLSSIQDTSLITPEAYYILGFTYFDKDQNVSAALHAFQQALNLLDSGRSVSHGYNIVDLRKRLESNIRKLE